MGIGEGMMPEANNQQQPPTYYANVVTSILNVDELVLELRRVLVPHRDTMKASADKIVVIPPITPEQMMREEPLARVVITFTAAKGLKEYLDQTVPRIEDARKKGQAL